METPTRPALQILVLLAVALMAVIVVLSAALRLSRAGLGCADWPACYGRAAAPALSAPPAENAGPPAANTRSWPAVVHHLAGSVMGMVILAIAFMLWRRRPPASAHRPIAPALLGLTAFLGVLGKWTPIMTLPIITLANILAGFALFALLWWLWLDLRSAPTGAPRGLKAAAYIGLALLVAQITLGGLVSANLAALSCATLPGCDGSWWPVTGSWRDFNPLRSLEVGANGKITPAPIAPLLHMSHRLGALPVFGYLAWLGVRMAGFDGLRKMGVAMLTLLALQVLLGAGAVALGLPRAMVVAHNGVAALLLLGMVTLIHRLHRGAAFTAAG